MRDPVVDPVLVSLVRLGAGGLPGDDAVERVPPADLHAGRRGEGVARDERAQLDELARGDGDGAERGPVAAQLAGAADPHGLPPAAKDLAGRVLRRLEPSERLV